MFVQIDLSKKASAKVREFMFFKDITNKKEAIVKMLEVGKFD